MELDPMTQLKLRVRCPTDGAPSCCAFKVKDVSPFVLSWGSCHQIPHTEGLHTMRM